MVVVWHDVTALHDLQQRSEDFVRMVSRDLRNPLSGIVGHAQSVLRKLEQTGADATLRYSGESIVTSARQHPSIVGAMGHRGKRAGKPQRR